MSQVWMSKRSAYRALFLFFVTLFAIDAFAQVAAPGVPEAPDSYTFSERDSRQRFDSDGNLIFPNFEYTPGYFFRNGGVVDDDDYDSQTVFRIEYGVENDGTTRSKIKETATFTIGGNIYNGLVRDFRAGVVAEPYDDIVVIRLLDDVDPDPETPLSNTNFPGYDGPLADLCTGTLPGSNATCADVGLLLIKTATVFFISTQTPVEALHHFLVTPVLSVIRRTMTCLVFLVRATALLCVFSPSASDASNVSPTPSQ